MWTEDSNPGSTFDRLTFAFLLGHLVWPGPFMAQFWSKLHGRGFKAKTTGDRRFKSMFPFTMAPFWVPILTHGHLSAWLAFRVSDLCTCSILMRPPSRVESAEEPDVWGHVAADFDGDLHVGGALHAARGLSGRRVGFSGRMPLFSRCKEGSPLVGEVNC